MELRQLRYFLSVADCRSFVSAAAGLYISRQAVSKAISQLEEELGVALFMRDTSGAFLTPTGLMFYDRIRGVVKEIDDIEQQIRTSGSRYRQRIRIAFSTGTVGIFEDRLLSFRKDRENLEMEYWEHPDEECIRLLQEHQTDLIVCSYCPQNVPFSSEEILRSRIGLLIRNKDGIEDLESVDVTDLSWLPIAAQQDRRLQEFCTRHRIALQYTGQDYHRLFSLTASGKCGLLLPECLVPCEMAGLRWLPLQQEEYWRLYSIYSQIADSNLLYSSILEEINTQVLKADRMGKENG